MVEPSAFGRRLRAIREKAGISASGLSTAAGASRDVVRQLEEGLIVSPNLELARRLADALGVPFEWLATGQGDAPSEEQLSQASDRVAVLTRRTGT